MIAVVTNGTKQCVVSVSVTHHIRHKPVQLFSVRYWHPTYKLLQVGCVCYPTIPRHEVVTGIIILPRLVLLGVSYQTLERFLAGVYMKSPKIGVRWKPFPRHFSSWLLRCNSLANFIGHDDFIPSICRILSPYCAFRSRLNLSYSTFLIAVLILASGMLAGFVTILFFQCPAQAFQKQY